MWKLFKEVITCISLFIIFASNYNVQSFSYNLNNVEYQFPDRHRFESLLAAGRISSYPFSPGLFFALTANEKSNWNVSLKGIQNILNLSDDQLLATYSRTMELLQKDKNVTVSSVLYDLHEEWNETKEESSKLLKDLGITTRQVIWDNDNANRSWEIMNNHLAENTNNVINGNLIPKETDLGRPFPTSTKVVTTSTFHYKNEWKTPWMKIGSRKFANSGKVPFVQIEGYLSVADERDFTAINIPLQGDCKSIVFVLPKIDITQFKNKVKAKTSRSEFEDVVPFPKKWETNQISLSIPLFNFSDLQQYGLELEELGMNETFCTTRRDLRGKFPFYLRPIVQTNSMEFSERFMEIASATGTAIQKFQIGLDISGSGFPKFNLHSSNFISDSSLNPQARDERKDDGSGISGEGDRMTTAAIPEETEQQTTETVSSFVEDSTTPVSIQTLSFDKPFLWYLNDATLGPLFYGIVTKIENPDSLEQDVDSEIDESSDEFKEAYRYLLWSCKSFKQSEEIESVTVVNEVAEDLLPNM